MGRHWVYSYATWSDRANWQFAKVAGLRLGGVCKMYCCGRGDAGFGGSLSKSAYRRVGITVAAVVPEGDAYTLWDKGVYAHTYGLPVGVKDDGKWRHPAGTQWTAEIAGLLDAAPFVGKPGG